MCKNVGDVSSFKGFLFDLIRKTCLRCCSVGRHALSWATGVRGSNGTEVTDLSAFRFLLCP